MQEKTNIPEYFVLHIFCLDKDKDEFGFKDYSIIFSDNSKDCKDEILIKNYAIFLCYNVSDPDFSPKGTCVCSFTVLVKPEYFEELKETEYHRFKTIFGKRMIELLKSKLDIDISNNIEEVEIATPWTFSRYLSSPKGTAYGHEVKDWDSLVARTLNIEKDYSIPGIYPIGCDTIKGDGYSSAYIVGKEIVDFALNRTSFNE